MNQETFCAVKTKENVKQEDNFNREDEHTIKDAEYDEKNILGLNVSEYSLGKHLYKCEDCDSVFKTRYGLWLHNRSIHKGIRYPCHQCEYNSTSQSSLKTHQKSKHTFM